MTLLHRQLRRQSWQTPSNLVRAAWRPDLYVSISLNSGSGVGLKLNRSLTRDNDSRRGDSAVVLPENRAASDEWMSKSTDRCAESLTFRDLQCLENRAQCGLRLDFSAQRSVAMIRYPCQCFLDVLRDRVDPVPHPLDRDGMMPEPNRGIGQPELGNKGAELGENVSGHGTPESERVQPTPCGPFAR